MKRIAMAASLGMLIAAAIIVAGCGGLISSPHRPLVGWAVGSAVDDFGTIIKTADGGATWQRQGSAATVANVQLNDVSALDAHTVWVVGPASDGYGVILRTTNGGETWVRQGGAGEIPDVELNGVTAIDADTAWVCGGQGTVLLTTDGGQTWQQKDTGYPTAGFGATAAASRDVAWIVGSVDEGGGERILIVKTSDGGATWVPQGSPTAFASMALIGADAVSEQVAWAVGTDYTVAYTRNGGLTWGNLPPLASPVHLNGVCGIGTDVAWVAADYNVVLRTTDAGRTWEKFVPPGGSGTTYILGVSAVDANIAYLVGSDFSNADDRAFIVYTTDGGATWTKSSSPANSALRRVSFAGAAR